MKTAKKHNSTLCLIYKNLGKVIQKTLVLLNSLFCGSCCFRIIECFGLQVNFYENMWYKFCIKIMHSGRSMGASSSDFYTFDINQFTSKNKNDWFIVYRLNRNKQLQKIRCLIKWHNYVFSKTRLQYKILKLALLMTSRVYQIY